MFLTEHTSIHFQNSGANSLYLIYQNIIHTRVLTKGACGKKEIF